MLTSIFRTSRGNRTLAAQHDESDRPESLVTIACEGDPSECYDPPNKEIPPSPAGPGPGDPDTLRTAGTPALDGSREDWTPERVLEPIATRVRAALESLLGLSPLAVPA